MHRRTTPSGLVPRALSVLSSLEHRAPLDQERSKAQDEEVEIRRATIDDVEGLSALHVASRNSQDLWMSVFHAAW